MLWELDYMLLLGLEVGHQRRGMWLDSTKVGASGFLQPRGAVARHLLTKSRGASGVPTPAPLTNEETGTESTDDLPVVTELP